MDRTLRHRAAAARRPEARAPPRRPPPIARSKSEISKGVTMRQPSKFIHGMFVCSSIVLGLGLLAGPRPAQAATLMVDTTDDGVDAMPGDGRCATSAGSCTLRAAIQEANALPGADVVRLPAGTYLIAREGTD